VVLFLKCIPNGGLDPSKVPTPDMYIQWVPNPDVLGFIAKNPIDQNQDYLEAKAGTPTDPFLLEAERVFRGLNQNVKFALPGVGEISLTGVRDGIKAIYDQLLAQGYNDYQARGGTPALSAEQMNALPQFIRELR
jgi:hypothetical protein